MEEEQNINEPQNPAFLVGAVMRSVIANRRLFLSELRSGKHKKGTIKSDEKGFPIFETEEDKNGHCCCAIMGEMFGLTENGKISLPKAMKELGLKRKDCEFIQKNINDNNSTLVENADRIESEVFKHFC
jgi:hypothetical protein